MPAWFIFRSKRAQDRVLAGATEHRPDGQHLPSSVAQNPTGLGSGEQSTTFRAKVEEFDVHTNRQHEEGTTSHRRANPNPKQKPEVLLNISMDISEATVLLKALTSTSGALRTVLTNVGGIHNTNEQCNNSLKRLQFHLDTIKSQSTKLEEDLKIDWTPLAPDPTIIKPLEDYGRGLNNIYQLMCERDPIHSSMINKDPNKVLHQEAIAQTIKDMDRAFDEYTDALHEYATLKFGELGQQLPQVEQDLPEAVGNSSPRPRKGPNMYGPQYAMCLQGTRENTCEAIRKWANDKSNGKPMFLLLDVAGSGKSTVAKHMAVEWSRNKRLVAQFSFPRARKTSMSKASFCSDVADAFSALDRRLEGPIKEFRERPGFAHFSLEKVFNGLVTEPLEKLKRDAILIIDALDECENEDGSRDDFLNVICSQDPSTSSLRILATSRPERDIRNWAQESGIEYVTFSQLEGSNKDIEVYIRQRLQGRPHIQHRLYSVIKHADGLFIYARIVCDLILHTLDVDTLLGELEKEVSMDDLYKVALYQLIPRNESSRRAFGLVLQMILASREPLSIAELEELSPRRGIVERIVTRLSSLLLYEDREDPIRLIHDNLREFLTTQSKAGIYFVQPKIGHHTLAVGCLDVLIRHSNQEDFTLRNLDEISKRQEHWF